MKFGIILKIYELIYYIQYYLVLPHQRLVVFYRSLG